MSSAVVSQLALPRLTALLGRGKSNPKSSLTPRQTLEAASHIYLNFIAVTRGGITTILCQCGPQKGSGAV